MLLSLLFPLLAAAQAPPPPPDDGLLTLQSGPYRVIFSARQAWTIYEFHHADHMLGHHQGFYGTVLIPDVEGGNWIGTGHTEGGREIVHSVTLTVDGHPRPLVMGETVTGERLELVKHSTIHAFDARATITVTPREVIQRQEMTAREDVTLRLLYLFMHCWVPTTTHWLAQLPDGEIIRGEFDNEGFEVRRDTGWVAQHEPHMGLSILQYTPRVASGTGSYTQIWDIPRYHKHYTQRCRGEAFAQGDKLDYTMIVQIVEGETGDWEATQAAARELRGRFAEE